MKERRRIHLGIDYGTSGSKIVLRDFGAPGGEKASVLCYRGSYRFPSSVCVVQNNIIFGSEPPTDDRNTEETWYESLKMRVAAEITGNYERFCYAPLQELPAGLSAKDLATLSLWWLISEGHRGAIQHLSDYDLAVGMTVGIPMSFFSDQAIRNTFLEIVRAAWYLNRANGILEKPSLEAATARRMLDEAYNSISKRPVLPDTVRDWIRSEAEAAMYSSFQSPSVRAGTYAKVDVGAGTTNASVFRITDTFANGRWMKTGMAFYGADSGPSGMDAIDRALWEWRPDGKKDWLVLRGMESGLLEEPGAVTACDKPINETVRIGRSPWKQLREKLGGGLVGIADPEWKNCMIYLLGGGGPLRAFRERLPIYPFDQSLRLNIGILECPSDLDFDFSSAVPIEILQFVLVAYGLSEPGLAVPFVDTPSETPPWSPPRKRPFKDYDDF